MLQKNQGEIYMNEAKCETHRIMVDDFVRPQFTDGFVEAMRKLQLSSPSATSNLRLTCKYLLERLGLKIPF